MENSMNIGSGSALRAQALFSEGLTLFQAGKLQEAGTQFANALALNPKNIDALNLAGICAYQKQEYESALHFLNQANELEPRSPYTHNTIGLIQHALKQYNAALAEFNIALNIQNNLPEIHNNRGNALKGLLQLQPAIDCYRIAIQLNPNYIEALNNLGVTLKELGKTDEALACFDNAIRINPNYAEAFNNAGTVFQEIGNINEALQCYEQALQIRPNYIEALLNYGNTFKKNKNFDSALQAYQKALSIRPNQSLAQYLIGEVLYEKGDTSAAQESYRLALSIEPDYPDARFGLAIATIPKVFKNGESIQKSREAFERELDELERWIPTSKSLEGFTNIGAHQPFYLAYQALDNKDLLTRFGKIGCDILKKWQESQSIKHQPSSSSGPIRLGIVSAHFSSHPVWHAITKGLLLNLDPKLFEVHLFDLGKCEDGETAIAGQHCASYTQGKKKLSEWAQSVVDHKIEALLFPEIGMDPLTRELASLRLAPLQMASWGHPETTGLTTIDYFISAEDLEPNNADENYSEKLIKLPNLGCFFESSGVTPSNLAVEDLGLRRDRPILLCPGSPSKYSPENDEVLVEIAKRLGKCQFVFFDFQSELTKILKDRLGSYFRKENLKLDEYVNFIPFQSKENFYALMKQSDLYLDTIGFSGFNTAMQAIECSLPVATKEGKFMRGRLASGILKILGIEALIAKTNQEYIEIVTDLILNRNILQKTKYQLNQKKLSLFSDTNPTNALQEYLISKCRFT
jgi:predicted O-linked N-acetylglucosamine transferase (SPINDLY family)